MYTNLIFLRSFLIVLVFFVPLGGYLRMHNHPEAIEIFSLRLTISGLALLALIVSFSSWSAKASWKIYCKSVFILNVVYSSIILPQLNHFRGEYLFSGALIILLTIFLFDSLWFVWTYLVVCTISLSIGAACGVESSIHPLLLLILFGTASAVFGSTHSMRIRREQDAEKFLREMTKAKEIAERATHAKAQFLSQMSHELRTPMNAIVGLSRLSLNDVEPQSEVHHHLSIIQSSARHLVQILNDILDFSKIEAGMLSIENIPFNPYKVLRSIHKTFLPLTHEKGIDFILDWDPFIAKVALGDPTRLSQIVNNLCSNAIKFTDFGEVRIQVTATPPQGYGDFQIKIDVSDSGVGIAPEKLKLIFERFSQADETISRRFGGTGLGLTITRQLVELLHGSIQVNSNLGLGSTFSVQIPYSFSSAELAPEREDKIDSLANRRILLVDDNRVNLMVAQKILMRQKAQVFAFDRGNKALEFLKDNQVDLYLVDLHMPEMDGIELLHQLRLEIQDEQQYIPCIVLTADAFEETRTLMLAQGFDGFVTKPIQEEILINEIQNALNGPD